MDSLGRLILRTKDGETEPDTDLLMDLLESAKNIILARRYPYGDWPENLDPRFADLQVRIAEDMFNRIGAPGQTHHSENGVSRTWGAEWVSQQLLAEIVPMAKVSR